MRAPSPSCAPGRSRANGPTERALADMRAGKMRERVDDRAVLHRHLLAEHHIGLDHDVVAEFGVGAEKHRLRRDQRDAGAERCVAQALLRHGFGFGELAFGVDAAHVVLLDFDRHRAELHAARDFDRIGQIEFMFAVVVADPLQDGKRAVAGKRHDAAVAESDLALARARIGFLANGGELVARHDEPPIAGRIGRPKAEHGDGRALRRAARAGATSVAGRISGVSP